MSELHAGRQVRWLWELSVREATDLQLAHVHRQREQRFAAFAELCGSGCSAQAVQKALNRAWQLPWDNCYKEVLWRLAYDGFLTPLRQREPRRVSSCCCGAEVPGIEHYFWDCRIAQRVIAELQACLPHNALELRKHHLWLGVLPEQLQGVGCNASWPVVTLAVLGAIDSARRFALSQMLFTSPAPPLHTIVPRAERRAIAKLWVLLTRFCALGLAPVHWRDENHIFFRWNDESQQWNICRPA